MICRRERAHPGAQFKFTDHDSRHFTCFLTDTEDNQIASLELRHRQRARVEDWIRSGKDTGMRNLPFTDFVANVAWLEISLINQDLLAWVKTLCLAGALAKAEPKRLRQRLFHVAGRICRSGRRVTLRLPGAGPGPESLRLPSNACGPFLPSTPLDQQDPTFQPAGSNAVIEQNPVANRARRRLTGKSRLEQPEFRHRIALFAEFGR